jgi:hypothetical protein
MTTNRPSAWDRDRAFDRLRSLTFGVGVAGLAATAGFGALAAATYAGKPSPTSTVSQVDPATRSGTSDDSSGTGSGGTAQQPSDPFANGGSDGGFGSGGFLAPFNPPVTSGHSGHASTGGSG